MKRFYSVVLVVFLCVGCKSSRTNARVIWPEGVEFGMSQELVLAIIKGYQKVIMRNDESLWTEGTDSSGELERCYTFRFDGSGGLIFISMGDKHWWNNIPKRDAK